MHRWMQPDAVGRHRVIDGIHSAARVRPTAPVVLAGTPAYPRRGCHPIGGWRSRSPHRQPTISHSGQAQPRVRRLSRDAAPFGWAGNLRCRSRLSADGCEATAPEPYDMLERGSIPSATPSGHPVCAQASAVSERRSSEPRGMHPTGSFLCAAVDATVSRDEGTRPCLSCAAAPVPVPFPTPPVSPPSTGTWPPISSMSLEANTGREESRGRCPADGVDGAPAPGPHLSDTLFGHPWIPDGSGCWTSEPRLFDPAIGYARTLPQLNRPLPPTEDTGAR
jgi:hypothetical protein